MVFYGITVSLMAGSVFNTKPAYTAVIKCTVKIGERKKDITAYGFFASEKGIVIASSLVFNKQLKAKYIKKLKCHLLGSEEEFSMKLENRDDELGLVSFIIDKDEVKKAPQGFTKDVMGKAPNVGGKGFIYSETSDEYGNVPLIHEFMIAAKVTKPLEGQLISNNSLSKATGSLVYGEDGVPYGYLGGKQKQIQRVVGGRRVAQNILPYTMVLPLDNVWSFLGAQDTHGWTGFVILQYLDEKVRKHLKVEQENVLLVSHIVPNSPASKAGFKIEDIIIKADGEDLDVKRQGDVSFWLKTIERKGNDAKVPFIVLRRNGDKLEGKNIELSLSEKPPTATEIDKTEIKPFGMEICPITWDALITHKLDKDVEGVLVAKVNRGSAAQVGGLRNNLIIYQVDDQPIKNVKSFQNIMTKLKESKPKEISVYARFGVKRDILKISPNWDTK
jgi:PDZ domain-containing protein